MDKNLSFNDRRTQELRLQILVSLVEQTDYTATDSLLYNDLNEKWMSTAMSDVRVALAWLNEEGLVVTQRPGGQLGFTMATLTQRGMDVANGSRLADGVARKLPGA